MEAEPFCSKPSIPLRELRNALAPAEARWRQLGVQFGFTEDELDAIRNGHSGEGVSQWLSSMLNAKLNNCPGFSWCEVAAALESIGQGTLAAHVRRTFCPLTPGPTEDLSLALLELKRENEARIVDEFADLLVQVCDHLETTVNLKSFVLRVKFIFAPAPFISEGDSVRKVFTAITDNNRWNYLHYRPLLRLVQRIDGNGALRERCRQYERSVSHFKFTTKLRDWIAARNSVPEHTVCQSLKLHPTEYSKLSMKVHVNVTEETLEYVTELWEDLAVTVCVPNLAAILHNIKEGCVLITWLIPNIPEIKNTISHNARLHRSFFEKQRTEFCLLDNDYLYLSHELNGFGDEEHKEEVTEVPETVPLVPTVADPQPVLVPPRRLLRPGSVRAKGVAPARTINGDDDESDTLSSSCSCCCVIM